MSEHHRVVYIGSGVEYHDDVACGRLTGHVKRAPYMKAVKFGKDPCPDCSIEGNRDDA